MNIHTTSRPGHRAAGRPGRDPDQPRRARRPVHRRDPPPQPRGRGDPLPGDGGLRHRRDDRPGPSARAACAWRSSRSPSSARRRAPGASARRCATASAPSTGSTTTRRPSWPRSSSARPASWAWRSSPRRSQILARRGRGTPRIVNRLLRRVRDYAQVRADGRIGAAEADAAMAAMDIDDEGLDTTDRRLLAAIVQKFASGPVGGAAVAAVIGEEVETIEDVYEPYLLQLGFLDRTPQGRVATERARDHLRGLGYEVPPPRRARPRRPGLVGRRHRRGSRPSRELARDGRPSPGTAATPPPSDGLAVATRGLVKRYGRRIALDGPGPDRAARHGLRLPGPQRRRQDDHAAPAGRACSGPMRARSRCSAQPYTWHDRKRLFRVGALIETPSFYPYLSGRETCARWRRPARRRPTRRGWTRCSSYVGLRGRAKDKVETYSLGMKQRLGIAAALLSRPGPAAARRAGQRARPGRHRRRCARRCATSPATGKTVVISSHILPEVQQLADVVGHHRPRRLVREGRIDELLAEGPQSGSASRADEVPRPLARCCGAASGRTPCGAGRAATAGWFDGPRADAIAAAEINRPRARPASSPSASRPAATSSRSSSS